jgi:alpha-galactosidase
VLDLSNPEVREFIFGMLDELLATHPGISYVKWDCNRSISDPGSNFLPAGRQEHLWIDYVRGYYQVLERITQKHPRVTFQACGSGGGRCDYGAMRHHHEFWTSDNTDARERILMQWSINHIYPAIASAAHVTESPNHYTGRTTPIKYRFDVAMTGRLGFELRPERIPPEELEYSKRALASYKRIRRVVQFGDLYRLVSPFETNLASLMYVLREDGAPLRSVFFAFTTSKLYVDPHGPVRLRGLDPDARYRLTELNLEDPQKPLTAVHGKTLGGDTLATRGLSIPWQKGRGDCQSVAILIEEE